MDYMGTVNPGGDKVDLERIVATIETLPSPAGVVAAILDASMDDAVDMRRIARLVRSDQAVALRVLAYVNSTSVGLGAKIATIEQAIGLLGLEKLKVLLLGLFVRRAFPDADNGHDDILEHVWKHSLTTAVLARGLAERSLPSEADLAFIGALVHDCGQLVMLAGLPEQYEPVLRRVYDRDIDVLEAENEALGFDHALVGRMLAKYWKLPREILEIIWLHHQPAIFLADRNKYSPLIPLASLANRMAHELMLDRVDPRAPAVAEERTLLLEHLRLSEKELDEIVFAAPSAYSELASIFNLDGDVRAYYFESMQRANQKLVRLNLEAIRSAERMDETNACLRVLAELGVELSCAGTLAEAIDLAVTTLREKYEVGRGFVVRFDLDNKRIHGLAWEETGDPEPIDCTRRPSGPARAACILPRKLHELAGEDGGACLLQDACPLVVEDYAILLLSVGGVVIGGLGVHTSTTARASGPFMAVLRQAANQLAAAMHAQTLLAEAEDRAERLRTAMQDVRRMTSKLVQTERLAAVGHLAVGAAHEINNPLAIISGRLQMLRQAGNPAAEDLEQMLHQVERISATLRHLMDFARPAEVSFRAVHVNEVVERALELVRKRLAEIDVALSWEPGSDLPAVEGDPNRLEQVVLNVLINAEHAMEQAGGKLMVRTYLDEPAKMVVIQVRDAGIGIPREHLAKIFDPFFSTKEEGKGTGLGLSTSLGIITRHHGEIDVKSKPGKGTLVTIRLPAADQA